MTQAGRGHVNCDSCEEHIAGKVFELDEEDLCRVCACDCGAESGDPNDHGLNCITTQIELED